MKRVLLLMLGLVLVLTSQGQSNVGVSPVGRIDIVRGHTPHKPIQTNVVSDVDKDIPSSEVDINYRVHVMIIVNHKYMDECPVGTALNDGKIMQEYCTRTLGIPEEQVILKENRTKLQMERDIKDFARDMEFNAVDDYFLFFYFGNGSYNADPKVEDSYLLPVDGKMANISREGVSLKWIIKDQFEKKNPSRLLVYLENSSCHSNADNYIDRIVPRSEYTKLEQKVMQLNTVNIYATASPTFILEPVPDDNFKGNIVVISASSSNDIAYALPMQNHNVFTYEFLKVLKQYRGDLTLGELYDRAKDATEKTAWRELRYEQRPTVIESSSLGDGWRSWHLLMK